jgi:AbrB family looped-hinge helix DNA binding protein
MVNMGEVGTVTSKSMVTIPSRIRRKYGLHQGSKVEFVEIEEGIFLVPLKSLGELRGAAGKRSRLVLEGVKELEREHREEAARDESEASP